MKYKYQGQVPVSIQGYGIVSPGDVIETELNIQNPNFRPVKEKEIKKNKRR